MLKFVLAWIPVVKGTGAWWKIAVQGAIALLDFPEGQPAQLGSQGITGEYRGLQWVPTFTHFQVRTGQSAPNSRLRHCLIRPTNSYLLPSNVSYGVPHPELLESRLAPVHSRGRPDHWSPPPSMHPLIPACLAPAAPAWRRMHASPSFPSPRSRSRSRSHGPAIPSPPHVRSQGFTPTTFKASHGQRLEIQPPTTNCRGTL